MVPSFKYIYGPVFSWRIGWSLGIDPISSSEKICNFNCVYCQLGEATELRNERELFVEADAVVEEIKQLPRDIKIDYFTVSGRGEPTLALNLGEIIQKVKALKKAPIAVITNAGLVDQEDVRRDLKLADLVLIKLDAGTERTFINISRPSSEISFQNIVKGMEDFRQEYSGKLALQIMFIKNNLSEAEKIAKLASQIKPDEVQLNTPLRPCPVQPLSENELNSVKSLFKNMAVRTVYESPKEAYKPLSESETILRHGQFSSQKR